MIKRWEVKKYDRAAVNVLAAELSVKPLVAALLIARGFDNAEKARRFLNPAYEHLNDPLLLKGIRMAADRVFRAIDNSEKVMIWGDYDVDGTTGTVLLRRALKMLGCETAFHVPNRFTEGYGLNIPALQQAKADGVSLVITVDCGIRSFEPITWAKENGLDVIVTDHHLSDEVNGNPPAYAIVNPNQTGCKYPDKHLAGVGVAFKLAQVLLRERGLEQYVPAFLKIAAIGTVADIMKLTGENRAIVALGLKDLPKTNNPGLRALMDVSECREEMTSYHIGFRIAPRINAAGRMDVARHVIELLEAEDAEEAGRLAHLLDSRNRERQQVQQKITELALFETENIDRQHFVVVSGQDWHRGVIGLAASKIAERLYRPTIVLSAENGFAHGSGRTIGDFHLLNALESCADLFEQFGGHAAAAGMTIKVGNIDELRRRLNEHASAILVGEALTPVLRIDAPVSTQTLNLELINDLAAFEPFGAGNPKPVFVTGGMVLRDDPYVMKEKHLKLRLFDEDRRSFEAVWWDGVERSKGRTPHSGDRIEIAYTPEVNVWQGYRNLQLVVEDIRIDNQKGAQR
jgi:single-stranded-DNA-specific exonuclease